MAGTLRDLPLERLDDLALLVVDVQYYCASPGEGENSHFSRDSIPDEKKYFFDRLSSTVLPSIALLQKELRAAGSEVIFSTIESLTSDGRDRGRDHKISDIFVPRGSKDAKVLEEVRPLGDEICLPKTTSSVFSSTSIEYVLRSLEVRRLIVTGLLTDQCVVSAVRDACDRGFLVIVPEDCCATYSKERHDWALSLSSGYCRLTDSATLIEEIRRVNSRGQQRSS